jgi:predicted LPLAT superfamily acyltransferase
MTSGSVAQWAQTSEAGSRWQLRFMRGVALRAPGWLTAPLIWMISFVFACQTRRPSTRASMVYLERLLGRPALFAERHRHARTFAHVFLDRARLLAGGLEAFRIDVQGQQLIERVHAAGRGGVLLGAHFGSFEALRAFDRSLPGLRVYYLMYPDHAPASTALLNELNREVAERIISLQDSQQAMLNSLSGNIKRDYRVFGA